MQGQPQLLTVHSSSPVTFSLEINRNAVKSMGVNTISEMNLHRWTALRDNEIIELAKFLAQKNQPSEILSLALYEETQLEPVDIQPYSRLLKDRNSFFAQQGELPDIHNRNLYAIGNNWPVGTSDQERAYCVLLERTLTLWSEGRPDYESRLALVSDYGARLDRMGAHNFSFWDGEYLYAYSSNNEGEIHPLYFYQMEEKNLNFGDGHKLQFDADSDTQIVVVTDVVLDVNSEINTIPPGAVACFRSGELLGLCEPVDFWTEE
ncbi:MAG: class II glutamine amidotransferase [Neptuniibacter sp.]